MKTKNLLALLVAALLWWPAYAQQKFPFENEIKAFQHQDSLNFPKPNGILFIGSSSIRKWTDLEKRFQSYPIIKRGIGGSKLEDLVKYYTPYVVFPYKPSKIFIYGGDNDLAKGASAQSVADSFIMLWGMISKELPQTDVYFLSLKLSPSRAKYYEEVKQTNKLISAFLAGKPKGHLVDVYTPILKQPAILPDSSLFVKDMLHLNSKGYDRWVNAIRPYIENSKK